MITLWLDFARRVPATLGSQLLSRRHLGNTVELGDFLQGIQDHSDMQDVASSLLYYHTAKAMGASKAAILVPSERNASPLMWSFYSQGISEIVCDEVLWDNALLRWLGQRDKSLRAAEVEALPQWKELSHRYRALLVELGAQLYAPPSLRRRS